MQVLSFLRAVLHRIGLHKLVAVPQANVTSALTRFVIDIAKTNTKIYTPPTAIQSSQRMKFSKNIRPYWPAEAP